MQHPMRLPPGPKESRVAQLGRFSRDLTAFYLDCAAEFGPVFTVRLFGQDPWVVVGEPRWVKEIFTTGIEGLVNGADPVKFMLGPKSMLFLEGEAHREERRVVMPHFHHGRMRAYAAGMVESADAAIDELVPGSRVRSTEAMVKVTLRTIVECVFGVTDERRRRRLERLLAADMEMTQKVFFFVAGMMLGGDRVRAMIDAVVAKSGYGYQAHDPPLATGLRRFTQVKSEVADILRSEIARAHAERGTGREDMLAMLEASRFTDGSAMSDTHLVDELMTLLIGGHETTSLTMAWVLYYLAKNPAIQERAREELDRVFGDGPLDAEKLDSLSYLGAILDETMRIQPLAATVPRRYRQPTQLGEWRVPTEAYVLPSPLVVHMREDLWPEPTVFRPERFAERPAPFTFLPFGGGARTCAGRTFALAQMKLVLAQWLRRVRYRLADDAAPRPAAHGILTGPHDGVPIVVESVAPRAA